jgi:Flp pilus assembly protein CpaB
MAIGIEGLRRIPLPAVSPRTMLGVGLAAAAALLVLVVTQPPATVPVLVAGADLPAGTPLSQLDVEVRRVADAEGLIQGDTIGELGEWVLAVPVVAGEPLLASILRPARALGAPDVMALQLDAANAVLGRLDPGDLVDVYATTSSPGSVAETRLIATSVYVLEARTTESTSRSRVELLLAVDRATARAITTAMHGGDIDLVKVGQ